MALKTAKVGLRLRRFREEQGLTQASLATALGISTSYVNQMESNQRPITGPVLLRLAEVFDVDVQRFSAAESDRLDAQLRDALADTAHALQFVVEVRIDVEAKKIEIGRELAAEVDVFNPPQIVEDEPVWIGGA